MDDAGEDINANEDNASDDEEESMVDEDCELSDADAHSMDELETDFDKRLEICKEPRNFERNRKSTKRGGRSSEVTIKHNAMTTSIMSPQWMERYDVNYV